MITVSTWKLYAYDLDNDKYDLKLSTQVTRFLSYTYAGSYFVFGFAADGKIFNPDNFKHNGT